MIFLKNEQKNLKSKLEEDNNNEEVIKQLDKIKLIIDGFRNNCPDNINYEDYANINLSLETFNYIKRIVYIFKDYKYTECDSYPLLKTEKHSDGEIVNFINSVYRSENIDLRVSLNRSNENSLYFYKTDKKILSTEKGICYAYKDNISSKNKLILSKYNNIKDLITPTSLCAEIITNNTFTNEVLKRYMYIKACDEYQRAYTNNQNIALDIQYNDEFIRIAKFIYNSLSNINQNIESIAWEQLDSKTKTSVAFFGANLIGNALSFMPIYANEIKDIEFIDKFGNFNLNNLNLDKEKIKKYSKRMKN